MTDLDIQIDVPDDDGLNTPVRVLNGSSVPYWVKIAAFVLGLLAVALVGAYLFGRSRSGEEEAAPTSSSAPIASAAASPAVESSLEAVQAWETFSRSGDLATVAPHFDESGPQYALFAASASGAGGDLEFSARNLSESRTGDLTTVSMDLIVTSAQGQEVFPYDFVYREGSERVWTVVDRRAPGDVALPPTQDVIDSASQNWQLFTSSMAIGDGTGAAAVVNEPTRELARQVAAAAAGTDPGAQEAISAALFDQLVARARAAPAEGDDTLVALLDANQRRALATGQLTAWTQVAEDRVVASLVVDGAPTATVPFAAAPEGWVFDLVGALAASEGGNQ
jgi:hypothetical protein